MASVGNLERSDTFTLSIRLRHENAELSGLAREFALPVGKLWKAGDPVRAANGNLTGSIRLNSYLSSRVATSEDPTLLSATIERAISKLQDHSEAISRFIEDGGTVEFLVGWFFEGTSGLAIQPAILTRMGDLGVTLSVMAYGDVLPGQQDIDGLA